MTMGTLTLAICTYNRSDLLPRALESVLGQTLARDQFEVLIVDNASTDGTRALVETYQTRSPGLRYVVETQPGIAHARNRAANEALGDYLAFIDDDAWAEPNWLAELIQPLKTENPPAGIVG